MFALSSALKARLQALPELQGFDVRNGTEPTVDRRPLPAADVRWAGANSTDSGTQAVQILPVWTVTLVAARADGADAILDAALSAAIASLHNWAPGSVGGMHWSRLSLRGLRDPNTELLTDGTVAIAADFATGTTLKGAPTGGR